MGNVGPNRSRKLIVVVEDDDGVRNLLERALSVTYDVEVITNGAQALQRVQEAPVPDLLICDIMLPGADGLTIARQAKATRWSRVPILFLTAKSTPRDVIEGIQAGARQYVTKPFKLKDVEGRVAHIVGK